MNGRFTIRERIEERQLLSHRNFSERMELSRDPQQRNASRLLGEPSLLEVGPVHPTVLKVGNSIERGSCPTFVTSFSREILRAPHLSKVKLSSIDLFGGTTDPDDHWMFIKHKYTFRT